MPPRRAAAAAATAAGGAATTINQDIIVISSSNPHSIQGDYSPDSTRSLSTVPDSEPPPFIPDPIVRRSVRTPASMIAKALPTPPETRRSSRLNSVGSTVTISQKSHKRKVSDDSDLDSDDLDSAPSRPTKLTPTSSKERMVSEADGSGRLPLKRREIMQNVGVVAKPAVTSRMRPKVPIKPLDLSQTERPVLSLPKGKEEEEKDEPLTKEEEGETPLEYTGAMDQSDDELIMKPQSYFSPAKKSATLSLKHSLSIKQELEEEEDDDVPLALSRPARAAKNETNHRVPSETDEENSDVPMSRRRKTGLDPSKKRLAKGKTPIRNVIGSSDLDIPPTSDEDDDSDFAVDSDVAEKEEEEDEALVAALLLSRNAAQRADAAQARMNALASGSGPGYNIDMDAEMAASLSLSQDVKQAKAVSKRKPAHRYKGKGKGKANDGDENLSSSVSDPDGSSDEDNFEYQAETGSDSMRLAEMQKEYVQLLELNKTEGSTTIRKKLGSLVKKIGQIEQASVIKQQAAMKKRVGRKLTQGEKNQIALWEYHPELRTLWGDLESEIPIIKPIQIPPPPGLRLQLLPFQKESLYWMKEQEKGIWRGGMLADEMGMGKTIQTIALLLSDHKERDMPCMVVAPVVALKQWKSEIETHTDGLKVMIYHGTTRAKSSDKGVAELKKYDVILTSFGTLQSGYTKQEKGFKRNSQIVKEKSLLHMVKWWRIILDEAHNIKDRTTNVAKACFALDASYKWCLSGTPLQNRVGELYSLIRFLGGDPYSFYFCKKCPCKSLHWSFQDRRHCDECGHNPMQHVCLWNNEILNPIVKYGTTIGEGKHAWKKLKLLLDRMMLRRTKLERADDLGLPPRTLLVRRDFFSPEERELYLSLFSDAKRQFTTYVDSGTVLNNYSNIFSLITRMRQLACHPDLVLRSKTATYIEDLGETTLCRLCNEVGEDVIMSKCSHCFDRACIRNFLLGYGESKAPCPVCNATLTIDLEAEPLEQDEEKVRRARQGILGRLDVEKWRSSTKVEALIEELSKLRADDVTTKSLVFSQFVSFLDIIAFRLKRAGFKVCRLEGGMSMEARAATIDRFIESPDVTIFLISLKAGGVALNLTAASRVFMMDSWWNPAIEYQAMDRIHRLGQHRPVICTKFAVEDSIESKIIQLQEKKLAMTEATLNPDASAMGKLTQEDLSFLFRM